jgi:tetratricopeptide (TPR) repeat protein
MFQSIWQFQELPKNSEVGAQLAEKKMLDEAIIIFEQIIFLGVKNAYVYTNLGQAYHEKRLIDKAAKCYCSI